MCCYLFLSADGDEYVKKNVAILIREVVKHTPEVPYVSWTSSKFCIWKSSPRLNLECSLQYYCLFSCSILIKSSSKCHLYMS